jgi:BNR/Asp-box repeat
MSRRAIVKVLAVAFATAPFFGTTPASASVTSFVASSLTDISTSCAGQNAEVEQAVDQTRGYVYELWMGCGGIAFARSTDGGAHFSKPISVPGSVGSNTNTWDPAITVGPDGTVYAAFMVSHGAQWYPVVAASFDHGVTFPQVSSLVPPDAKNWGDRDFIAVGPDGTVYVTWDYGPNRTSVTDICAINGSCAFLTGDLNAVVQRSTDGGKTWSAIIPISPGFPASGGDLAPLVIEPSGRVDVLYQGYQITNTTTYTMNPAVSYFTSSSDRGSTWSTPVAVGAAVGTMSLSEWWIDDDIGIDSGGNLYATWDTQGTNADDSANDIGWLSFSANHGRSWSAPVQAPSDQSNVPHIMAVVGGAAGTAYVSWLSNSDPRGYALYLRTFSTKTGWLAAQQQVSTEFGDPAVWPGDTTGISTLSPSELVLSWGSATPSSGKKSDIFVADVGVSAH